MSMLLMAVSGLEGSPLPYSPRTDDVIALILLICFVLSSIALSRSKRYLSQQAKAFIVHRERSSIFSTSTATDVHYLLLLVLQTCILGGICIFNYFNDTQPTLMGQVSPRLLLAGYVAACLFYILFKWVVYSLLGWVFFDKNRTALWMESYFILIYYLGFVLFPFVLLLVYFDLQITFLVSISFFLIIFAKILMFYKWIKLFFNNISGLFLLILYFCALEIIPCLLIYRVLIEINNMSVIKF